MSCCTILKLTEDGAAVNLANVTRYLLTVGSETVDSDTAPAAFDASAGSGVLALILGDALSVAGTNYARLVLFDDSNPDGVVWVDAQGTPNKLQLVVLA